MYRYRVRRKKSFIRRHGNAILVSAFAVAAASFGYLGAASSDIDHNSRFFSEGLKIKLDRGSPAFAALEDSWIGAQDSGGEKSSAISAVRLSVGESSAENIVEKLIRDNQRERALIAQERAAREVSSQAMAQAAALLLKKMSERFQPQQDSSALASNDKKDASETEAPIVNKISLAELNISREELLSSLFLPITQYAGMEDESRKVAGTKYSKPRFPSHKGQNPNRNENDHSASPHNTAFVEDEGQGQNTGDEKPVRQVIISGNIEFSDGLALTNPLDRLVVYREVDGEAVEAGAVWVREARYTIFVEETVGHLVGELLTPYGDVIGRGMIDLAKVANGKQAQGREISGVHLTIKPIIQGVNGRIVIGDAKARTKTGLKDAYISLAGTGITTRTTAEGRYSVPDLSHGSNVIVRAERPGYWGTIAFVQAGDNSDLELFEDREGSIIHELVKSAKDATKGKAAVVFGRVTYRGKPVAGARVELVTSDGPKAVYFNESMKPDPSLESTSNNGFYVFYPVSEGSHAVQVVWKNGRTLEPLIFPTEVSAVSRVDIEAARDRSAKVKVFDAFRTDYALPAEIAFLGDHRIHSVDQSGVRNLKYAAGPGIMVLEAHSGPAYERTRLVLDRDRNLIYFPMIQTSWLRSIQGTMRVNAIPGRGTIVGFVQGNAPYKVSLSGTDPNSVKVVYFNNVGEILPTEYGEPGGGFVIFNVEEGFQTVTIQSSGSLKTYSTVSLIERNVVNVISQWLR